MSRDDGFQTADVSTALLDDPKVRRLWRILGDQGRTCEAITAYIAVVLASWGYGRRVSLDEALPVWIVLSDDVAKALRTVGLLDKAGKVSTKAWDGWHGPAVARREAKRRAGRSGGLAKAEHSSSTATAQLYPSIPSVLSNPAVPSEPSDGLPYLTREALDELEKRTGHVAPQSGQRQLSEYDRLVGDYGLTAVLEAFDAVSGGKRMSGRQLVWGAVKVLEPFLDAPRIDPSAQVQAEVSSDFQRRVERTQRELQALREVGS